MILKVFYQWMCVKKTAIKMEPLGRCTIYRIIILQMNFLVFFTFKNEEDNKNTFV